MALVGLIDFSYSRIFKMPVLIIGDDRVKKHTPLQRGYTDIMFEDVDDFRLVSLNKIYMIAIKYSPAGYRKLMDESNALNRALIRFNIHDIGAEGWLNTTNMTMPSTEIYKLLNKRFDNYKKSHKV